LERNAQQVFSSDQGDGLVRGRHSSFLDLVLPLSSLITNVAVVVHHGLPGWHPPIRSGETMLDQKEK
jgi:hypothetical protein